MMVDAAAARIIDLLERKSTPTNMTEVHQSLSQEERDQLRESMQRIQSFAAETAQTYGLAKQRKDLKRIVAGEISQIWTTLENCRPQRMGGMGKIDDAIALILEQDMQRMLRRLDEVIQMISE